jgi:hypothetical protein
VPHIRSCGFSLCPGPARAGRSSRAAWLIGALALAPTTLSGQDSRADNRTAAAGTATVTGSVYDSIAGVVLRGAFVQYVGADDSLRSRGFSARSDSSGRYVIADVPPGRYLAGFFTTDDTLGIETGPRLVEVRAGEQFVNLATRSPGTVIRAMCPQSDPADSTGLLIGHVRDADADEAVTGATVVLEWSETVIEGTSMRQRIARLTEQSQGPGWFAMCGVPSDALLTAYAAKGADSSGFVLVNIPSGNVRHMTFRIGGATPVPIGPPALRAEGDSTPGPLTVLRGRARLTGTVRDEKGRPVEGAHALVWGTELEAVTNQRGVFTLDSLPAGTRTVEVRAVRYVPVYATVQLSANRSATADVTLSQRAVTLSTVTVRGELVYSKRLADFEARRSEGWGLVGHFISPAEIERRPGTRLSGLLQGVSGVFVDSRRGGAVVRMRSTSDAGSFCTPSLYVDGTRDVVADFNEYLSDRIAGIEVYPRDSWRPTEFVDANACGAIAIWTRAPRKR